MMVKDKKNKIAFITGITGQDGAYLAKHLIDLGYQVHGGVRRTSSGDSWRLLYLGVFDQVTLHDFEITEYENIKSTLLTVAPTEIYNLAAQSFVGASFLQPMYTSNVNFLGVLNVLEVVKNYLPHTRVYQASTSEMFGLVQETPQTEKTPFYPRSPYAVSKLAAHWLCLNYAESYGLYCASGILFNHESPLRGMDFVTRKISSGIARYASGYSKPLELGNLNAKRDWGFAGEFVKAMHLMLQQEKPDVFVISTNKTHSIRDFISFTCEAAEIDIVFEGEGLQERVIDKKSNKIIISVSDKYFRPADVELLIGDNSKAKSVLAWEPEVDVKELAKLMYYSDVEFLTKI